MTSEKVQPMGLDDDVQAEEQTPRDVDGIPYCKKHHCRMKQTSGGKGATKYYSCPVKSPKCDQKAQIVKTAFPTVVPPHPTRCQNCAKIDGNADAAPYCTLDESASSPAMVILKCPVCGHKSGSMPTPTLAAQQLAARARVQRADDASLGDR